MMSFIKGEINLKHLLCKFNNVKKTQMFAENIQLMMRYIKIPNIGGQLLSVQHKMCFISMDF